MKSIPLNYSKKDRNLQYFRFAYSCQRVICIKSLTQILTQNGKRAGGGSGASSAGKHPSP